MKMKLITYFPIRAQLTHLDQINVKNDPYQHGCIYVHEISQLDTITMDENEIREEKNYNIGHYVSSLC
jgi:hypothetical protein